MHMPDAVSSMEWLPPIMGTGFLGSYLYLVGVSAMAGAGVDARHINVGGQIHTSLTAVDMIMTGAEARAEMAAALRAYFGATVPL